MTNLVLHRETSTAITLPAPRGGDISIRLAVPGDIAFIDQLQRKHARMVGWFPTKQIEANIAKGRVLIAECHSREGGNPVAAGAESTDGPLDARLRGHDGAAVPVGYCIASDKYLKRDELGIVYQLNVLPSRHRGLIGATLIKAVFDRAAYGCKLFCCWCAQDLQANHFWESLGFVPLAFRTGSRVAGRVAGKRTPRIHIFWQRRIREGDTETPYWFPSETTGGAIKENRLVLPIPPGTHWSDAKPAVLPGMENIGGVNVLPPGASDPTVKKERKPRGTGGLKVALPKAPAQARGGLWFTPQPGSVEAEQSQQGAKAEKPKRPREKFKHDPKIVEAARELRDRYTEQINAGLLLPPSANGKYDVSRQLAPATGSSAMEVAPVPAVAMLEAA